jgi:hypothetical protein
MNRMGRPGFEPRTDANEHEWGERKELRSGGWRRVFGRLVVWAFGKKGRTIPGPRDGESRTSTRTGEETVKSYFVLSVSGTRTRIGGLVVW